MYTNNIDDWMAVSDLELDYLYETAKTMDSIVEIGSYRGRSTDALLNGCKGTVYAIDPFIIPTVGPNANSYEIFVKNVGHYPNLKVLKMQSQSALAHFMDQSVDMVFIDGCHIFSECRFDITHWLPKTRKLICGHDYYPESFRETMSQTLPLWRYTIQVSQAVNSVFNPTEVNLPVGTIWAVKLGK